MAQNFKFSDKSDIIVTFLKMIFMTPFLRLDRRFQDGFPHN
jgi:hypothetical protein